MNSELSHISSKPKTERVVKEEEFNRILCASLNVRSEVISIKKDILFHPENESIQLIEDVDSDDESSKVDSEEERKGGVKQKANINESFETSLSDEIKRRSSGELHLQVANGLNQQEDSNSEASEQSDASEKDENGDNLQDEREHQLLQEVEQEINQNVEQEENGDGEQQQQVE